MADFEAFVDSLFDLPVLMFNNTIRVFPNGRVDKLYKCGIWGEVENTPNSKGKYNTIKIDGKMYGRNKLVGACFLNHPLENKLPIDHANGVFLDNRVSNLRSSTVKDNLQNTDSKCYSWRKSHQKWEVRLYIDGKQTFFGLFKNEADAAARALELKLEHYPSFRVRYEYNLANGI